MAKVQRQPTIYVSLALGWAVACHSALPESSTADSEMAGSSSTGDSAETGDSADLGDSAETGDDPDPSDTTGTPVSDLPPDLPPDLPDPDDQVPPDAKDCHAIYSQDLLPTFEITVHPVVWDEITYLWNHGTDVEDDGDNPKKHFPLQEFRYGDMVIEDAEIRLRGNVSNWDPVPGGDKMQFQIGFHRNDKENGNFLGLKRVVLDAHTSNEHMLRDRLSLAIMREAGIAAPCANNARLVVNGEYYGIFTNLEKLDEVFVDRVFGEPTGDLWKRHGWELKTNKDNFNDERLQALIEADSTGELDTYLKLEQALRIYAADSVIPNSDGIWAGGLNFYLYDHPIDGKFWLLPWDLDNSLERFNDGLDGEYPMHADPVVWEKSKTHGRTWYDAALEDDLWFKYYIEQIDEVLHQAYTPEQTHAWIDEWSAQIEDAVLTDENKPWTNEDYFEEVEQLHDFVELRYHFVDEWLQCWKDGGEKDNKGYCEPK